MGSVTLTGFLPGWHHVAIVYSSSAKNVSVFYDGAAKGQASVDFSSSKEHIAGLGSDDYGSSQSLRSMSQMAFYQAILAPSEINSIKGDGKQRTLVVLLESSELRLNVGFGLNYSEILS